MSTAVFTSADDEAAAEPIGRSEIEVIEARIEHLSARAERCRKVMRTSRLAIVVGAIALVAMAVGLLRFEPAIFVTALAAVLGGFPLLGSTNSTLKETLAALRDAEARRAGLIDALALQPV